MSYPDSSHLHWAENNRRKREREENKNRSVANHQRNMNQKNMQTRIQQVEERKRNLTKYENLKKKLHKLGVRLVLGTFLVLMYLGGKAGLVVLKKTGYENKGYILDDTATYNDAIVSTVYDDFQHAIDIMDMQDPSLKIDKYYEENGREKTMDYINSVDGLKIYQDSSNIMDINYKVKRERSKLNKWKWEKFIDKITGRKNTK